MQENKHKVISIIHDIKRNIALFPETLPAARFVGTLESNDTASMACLLENGTVLTTLHSIFDFEARKYFDLSDMTVTFVSDNRLFTYSIVKILHDGLPALFAGSGQFEYACLQLSGNPVADLQGGLTLDTNNHWSGMAGSNEPASTVAISGPLLTTNNEHDCIIATQFTSTSTNAAASGGFYLFNQEGNHHGNPGFSGQALIYPGTTTLYAMHVGLDQNQANRFGIKISEYLLGLKQYSKMNSPRPDISTIQFPPQVADIILNIRRERLRRNGADIKDVTTFLDLLSSGNEISPEQIPQIFKTRVVDSHQEQHLGGPRLGPGYRSGKAYFYERLGKTGDNLPINALANCVNKLVSEFYQHHMKTPDAVHNKNLQRSTKFVIAFDVNIGIDVKAGNQATNLVLIDGFGGASYHIYPVTPESLGRGVIPTYINAREIIQEAIARNPQRRVMERQKK